MNIAHRFNENVAHQNSRPHCLEFNVPLLLRIPLFPLPARSKITFYARGIKASILYEKMTRSSVVEASSAERAVIIAQELKNRFAEIIAIPAKYSRFTQFINLHTQIVANLLYLRFEFTTGDASGHNMVTLAAEHILNWLLQQYPDLSYVYSAKFCMTRNLCRQWYFRPREICHR